MDFENLYVKEVQYLQAHPLGGRPIMAIGSIRTYTIIKRNAVLAVLLHVVDEKAVTQEEKDNLVVIPLQKAIDYRPDSLNDAVVSWMTYKYEDKPSTVLIHTGEITSDIEDLSYTHVKGTLTRNASFNEFVEAIEKARQIAKDALITQGITPEEFKAVYLTPK